MELERRYCPHCAQTFTFKECRTELIENDGKFDDVWHCVGVNCEDVELEDSANFDACWLDDIRGVSKKVGELRAEADSLELAAQDGLDNYNDLWKTNLPLDAF